MFCKPLIHIAMITEIVKDSAEATTPTPRPTTEDSAPVVREIAPVVPQKQGDEQAYSTKVCHGKLCIVLNPESSWPTVLGANKIKAVLNNPDACLDFLAKYGKKN